jgi:trans-AT polyketide synthase/acyltransferase/oxidoreductase domain-containing protein
MKSASEEFRGFLNNFEFKAPAVPVIANATAAAYPTDPESIKDILARQIAAPVRWTEIITDLLSAHPEPECEWLELGPNAVLTGLLKRIRAAKQ